MHEHGDGSLKKLSAGAGRHLACVLRHCTDCGGGDRAHSKGSDGVSNLKYGVFCHASTCILLESDMFFQITSSPWCADDISQKTNCCLQVVKEKVSMSVNTDYRAAASHLHS